MNRKIEVADTAEVIDKRDEDNNNELTTDAMHGSDCYTGDEHREECSVSEFGSPDAPVSRY